MASTRASRKRPSAYLAARVRSSHNPDCTIVLSTGRGDSKLTAAEARELAAELVAAADAAEAAEARDGKPTTPHEHEHGEK